MKVHIVYHVDDDAPVDMLIEADNPADLYQLAEAALSSANRACLDRIRFLMAQEFLPYTSYGDPNR